MPSTSVSASASTRRLGDEALGDDVGGDPVLGERPRGARADRGDGRAGEGAGVEAGRGQRLEQQARPRWGWSGRPARSRRSRRPRARTSSLVEPRLDPDRRQLDDLGAERAQGRGQAARLGAGAGDDDPPAVQGAALEPGERLAPRDHRADDDQRRRA